jgi:nitroreductase
MLPRQIEPVALIPLGYPADVPKTKNRKALDEIVHYNKFDTRL